MVVLSDLITHDQYAREVLRASIAKSVFWQSGQITADTELTRLMSANVGAVFQFDYFNDLADNEPRISDDSNTMAGTDGITTGTDQAVGNFRNRSWGAKNITKNLSATGDPMEAIAGRVGAYWARAMDTTCVALANGIIAGNILNDASDMVNNQTGVAIDINMILDTQQTAGDSQDYFTTMITHSAVRNKLKKDGVTDKIYDDGGNFLYEALGGLRLVITDGVPTGITIPGGAAGDYLSYITGPAWIGYGEGTPKRANEVDYVAATGNGAGEERLWSRKNYCLHPYGFSFLNAAVASTSPTNAEFADSANWQRNIERKRVPFAALIAAIV